MWRSQLPGANPLVRKQRPLKWMTIHGKLTHFDELLNEQDKMIL
jgi:hypothetical protein